MLRVEAVCCLFAEPLHVHLAWLFVPSRGVINTYPDEAKPLGADTSRHTKPPQSSSRSSAQGQQTAKGKRDEMVSAILTGKTKEKRCMQYRIIYPPCRWASQSSKTHRSICRSGSTGAAAASTARTRHLSTRNPRAGGQTASSGLGIPSPDDCFSWRATAISRARPAPS